MDIPATDAALHTSHNSYRSLFCLPAKASGIGSAGPHTGDYPPFETLAPPATTHMTDRQSKETSATSGD
jgi:hypothetical protein